MKKTIVALGAALALAVGGNVYQAVPESAPAKKIPPAQLRVEKFMAALKKGDWKAAAEVLSYYCANRWMSKEDCQNALKVSFDGSGLRYKMVGTTQVAQRYAVVTVMYSLDDPSTKANEAAVCEAKWAEGKDCGGAYTFGVALSPSVEDILSGKKNAKQHFYIAWVD